MPVNRTALPLELPVLFPSKAAFVATCAAVNEAMSLTPDNLYVAHAHDDLEEARANADHQAGHVLAWLLRPALLGCLRALPTAYERWLLKDPEIAAAIDQGAAAIDRAMLARHN